MDSTFAWVERLHIKIFTNQLYIHSKYCSTCKKAVRSGVAACL